jgi:hypothetical protein
MVCGGGGDVMNINTRQLHITTFWVWKFPEDCLRLSRNQEFPVE